MLCLDCSVVDCAVPICARGYELFTPEGECCSQCRRGKNMAHTIFSLPYKCQLVLITILQTLTICINTLTVIMLSLNSLLQIGLYHK